MAHSFLPFAFCLLPFCYVDHVETCPDCSDILYHRDSLPNTSSHSADGVLGATYETELVDFTDLVDDSQLNTVPQLLKYS
jgi:hypothetical protein